MRQAFLYSLKVWLTSIAFVYLYILPVYEYHVSQPGHSKEWALDPLGLTLIFVLPNLFFLPAWGGLAFLVKPIKTKFDSLWKQKAALNMSAVIMVIATVIPFCVVFIADNEDKMFITGLYLLAVTISTWLYKPKYGSGS